MIEPPPPNRPRETPIRTARMDASSISDLKSNHCVCNPGYVGPRDGGPRLTVEMIGEDQSIYVAVGGLDLQHAVAARGAHHLVFGSVTGAERDARLVELELPDGVDRVRDQTVRFDLHRSTPLRLERGVAGRVPE